MLTHPPTITIAIAEDHAVVRKSVIAILQSMFADEIQFVCDASNGKELIALLEQLAILPDIVLLDISMPIMNGYEAMKIIKHKWPSLKVVAFSMYNDDFAVMQMVQNGACGFITKDLEPIQVRNALIEVHTKGKYYYGVSSRIVSKSAKDLKSLVPNLTEKEMAFLALCPSNMKYEEMAKELRLSLRTIHSYRDILFKKLGVNTRFALGFFALRIGLVPNQDILHVGKFI